MLPLAGASKGTESSISVSPPELITSSEVEQLHREDPTTEEEVGGTDKEQESEEEDLEEDRKAEEEGKKPDEAEVPKHRRTYCRKAACPTCKVQCGQCRDCMSNNSKTCCRERPQCPDKKPRDLRPAKGKEAAQPGVGPAQCQEAKSRSRTMLRRSQSMSAATPVKIPAIFRAPDVPDDTGSKKRKQVGITEEDSKRRNTSSDTEAGEGKARRNSLGGPSAISKPIQMRRQSGLPIFSTMCKTGESTPQEVVGGPNP